MNSLNQFLNYFIPTCIKEDKSDWPLNQIRLGLTLNALCLILILSEFIIDYSHGQKHQELIPLIYGLSSLYLILNPFILKTQKSIGLFAWMSCLFPLIFIPLISYLHAGITTPEITWMLIGPLMAQVLLEKKSAFTITILSFAEVLIISYLDHIHFYTIPISPAIPLFDFIDPHSLFLLLFASSGSFLFFKEMKDYEVKLFKMREKAVAAIKSKDIFWSNLSHEIRTPLNGIKGMSSVLLDGHLSKEQEEIVQIIRESGDTLSIILNDVFDYTQLQAGELKTDPRPFNLGDAVESVFQIFNRMAEKKDIELSYIFDRDVPYGLLSDERRIKQVLINLIGNAIKFTEKGAVKLIIEKGGWKNTIQFSIIDTGMGISPKNMKRLFMPFTQIDSSSHRRFGGTGLGLAISQELVKLLGGEIQVKSQQAKGSTFIFTITALPIKGNFMARQENQIGNPFEPIPFIKRVKSLKILVAEDNPVNFKLMNAILKKLGHHTDWAKNGEEAIEQVQNTNYDIIFMDIQMPTMDGITATKEICRLFPDKKTRPHILALTANVLAEDKDQCIEAGMEEFLTKPINTNILTRALARYSDQIYDPKDFESMEEFVTQDKPDPFHGTPYTEGQFSIIDFHKLSENFEGDWEIIHAMSLQFLECIDESCDNLKLAIANHDHQEVERHAHLIKGSTSIFFPDKIIQKLIQIEKMGKNGDLNGIQELHKELGLELHILKEELNTIIGQQDAA